VPRIDLIPETLYQAMQPYHVDYDNLPLTNILERQSIINAAVDVNTALLRDAIGTQGTLDNRISQSLNQDGSLKASAMNTASHSIAFHSDGSDGSNDYVRMLEDERDKLTLVSDEASALSLKVRTASTDVDFIDDIVEFQASDTITWEVESPSVVKAHMAFTSSAAHRHYYGLTPVHVNLVTPDYTNYQTTSTSTAFVSGSLRVFINGVRIYSDDTVYVPDATVSAWTATSFTPAPASGTFALNRAITVNDVIRIDFNTLLT